MPMRWAGQLAAGCRRRRSARTCSAAQAARAHSRSMRCSCPASSGGAPGGSSGPSGCAADGNSDAAATTAHGAAAICIYPAHLRLARGLLDGSRPGPEILKLLRADAGKYTWVAAAIGSNSASGYQLESGYSVMPIGGFNGTDPSPTLERFQKLVADGEIHYFIAGGHFGGQGRRSTGRRRCPARPTRSAGRRARTPSTSP